MKLLVLFPNVFLSRIYFCWLLQAIYSWQGYTLYKLIFARHIWNQFLRHCLRRFWKFCSHHSFQIHLCWRQCTSFQVGAWVNVNVQWVVKNSSLREYRDRWKCIRNNKQFGNSITAMWGAPAIWHVLDWWFPWKEDCKQVYDRMWDRQFWLIKRRFLNCCFIYFLCVFLYTCIYVLYEEMRDQQIWVLSELLWKLILSVTLDQFDRNGIKVQNTNLCSANHHWHSYFVE